MTHAPLITRKQSQRRFFRKTDCDCRDCLEQDRRFSRWIAGGVALVVAAVFFTYAIVRSWE